MSSDNRSSSAVRNLRSIFENKKPNDPTASPSDPRGRSPHEISSDKENSSFRPTSKVRANFVAVAPAGNMATATEEQGGLDVAVHNDSSQVGEKTAEPVATPLAKLSGKQPGKQDKTPVEPDKPVAGAKEEPNDTKLGNKASDQAVSGGGTLPAVAKDLKSKAHAAVDKIEEGLAKAEKKMETKKPATNGRPSAISTKMSSKPASGSMKSPASQPKTPVTAQAPSSSTTPSASNPHKAPLKKASRSSLTAPTAASMARTSRGAETAKTSPTSKPKPREVTKPVNLPSHLTAPTAASRAKHEPEKETVTPGNLRASTTSKPKPVSARPTPRTSLAPQQRSDSRTSSNSARKSTSAPDGSFLERMTRPTAASANRLQDKTEVKSPPRTKTVAPKPKGDAQPAKPSNKSATPSASSKVEEPSATSEPHEEIETKHVEQHVEAPMPLTEEPDKHEPAIPEAAATADSTADAPSVPSEDTPKTVIELTGNETPRGQEADDETETDAALEATPAALGSTEETIR